jgi:NADH:ubiquinone oxidoreductase subunit 3 (subunit A)
MKKILEVLVCFLHPLAVVLAWINLLGRSDLSGLAKLAWAVFMIVPVVPFVYVLTGGDLW